MATRSYWLVNSKRSRVKRFIENTNNKDETRYGIKGGRYEMRVSKKTGKPYRHYF